MTIQQAAPPIPNIREATPPSPSLAQRWEVLWEKGVLFYASVIKYMKKKKKKKKKKKNQVIPVFELGMY